MSKPCPICGCHEYDHYEYSRENLRNSLNLTSVNLCKSCNLGLAMPRLKQDTLDQFYKSGSYWDSQTSNNKFSIVHQKVQSFYRVNYIKSFLSEKPNNILDVGAGNGFIGEFTQASFPGSKYFFLEPDPNLSNKILNRVTDSKQFSLVESLDEGFDVIFINHVLEHVENPVTLINQYKKLLSPRGILYIETPNQDFKFKNSPFPHTLFFSKKSMKNLIKKVEMNVLDLTSFGRMTFVDPTNTTPKLLPRLFAMSVRVNIWFAQRAFNNLMFRYNDPTNGIWLRAIVRSYN